MEMFGKAKVIHLYTGVDLMGSKTSVHYKEAEIEVYSSMCIVYSKKTKRKLFIPMTNVKGGEFLDQPEAMMDTSKKKSIK